MTAREAVGGLQYQGVLELGAGPLKEGLEQLVERGATGHCGEPRCQLEPLSPHAEDYRANQAYECSQLVREVPTPVLQPLQPCGTGGSHAIKATVDLAAEARQAGEEKVILFDLTTEPE